MTNNKKIIPFYGGTYPELFEIERRCMDRDGEVIRYLDQVLPKGLVLDVGAGNGYTAEKLTDRKRTIVAMEPDEKMIDRGKNLIWSDGVAQQIPFHSKTFDAVYSTWAFFFNGISDIEAGLEEVERVVRNGGKIIIVDNFGEDEFSSFSEQDISSNVSDWVKRGFDYHVIHTAFEFDSVEEAKRLLSFYFAEKGSRVNKTRLEYKVAAYTKIV